MLGRSTRRGCGRLLGVAVAGVLSVSSAWGACSDYRGRVVFNEVFDPSSGAAYLEVKTLDSDVALETGGFSGWKIAVYQDVVSKKSEVNFGTVFADISKNTCGTASAWIRIPDAELGGYINGSNGSHNLNFVLYETSGAKIVDILRLGAANSFYGSGTNYASCPEIEGVLPNSQYDAAWGSNGNKDWFRDPDGTGAWGGQATSNVSGTTCATNTPGTSSAAANFDCIETGLNYTANAVPPVTRNPLYTKLAGTNFAFDVVALKSNGTIETNYVGTGASAKSVTVELIDNSNSALACASRPSLGTAYNKTVTFAAGNTSGRTTTGSFTVTSANKTVGCRVTDGSGAKGCSVDSFAIRPQALTATSTATNVAATGTPVFKAGTDAFTLTATAAVPNYIGTPKLSNTAIEAHSGSAQVGALSPTTFASAATTGSGSPCSTTQSCAEQAFTYDEVGNFKLKGYAASAGSTTQRGLYDDTFTATDVAGLSSADCTDDYSNTLVGGKYGCKFGLLDDSSAFGRFIPDHFAVTPAVPAPGCGIFTYFAQDGFGTPFTLTAQNAANGTTKNYQSDFAAFAISDWAAYGFATKTSLPTGSVLSAGTPPPTGGWSEGVASVDAKHQVSRPAAATGETSVMITAKPVDADGVTTVTVVDVSTAVTPLRYGRLQITNAYGSELLDLPIPLTAQYWTGSAWTLNSADSCTSIDPNSIVLSDWRQNLVACETRFAPASAFSLKDGRSVGFRLKQPGAGNHGSVLLTLNLGSAPIGSTCVSTVASPATAGMLPRFGSVNPSARASFGVYRSPLIDRRESY